MLGGAGEGVFEINQVKYTVEIYICDDIIRPSIQCLLANYQSKSDDLPHVPMFSAFCNNNIAAKTSKFIEHFSIAAEKFISVKKVFIKEHREIITVLQNASKCFLHMFV